MAEENKHYILVVEDDLGIQAQYKNTLQKAGYSVQSARNYSEAINALKQHSFSLALIDVRLDGEKSENKDGLRILGEVSKMEEGPIVILSTGYLEDIDEQSKQYAYEIIDKANLPNRELLLNLVRDAINSRGAPRLLPALIRDSLYRIIEHMARKKLQLDAVCNLILNEMLPLIGAEAGNLFIVRENQLVAVATAHGTKTAGFLTLDIENSISGLAVRRYETIYIPDLKNSKFSGLYQPGLDIEPRSELVIPAIFGVEPIAVLNFESSKVNAFRKADIERLEKEFAPTVAIALHDAILQQSLIDQAKHVIELSDISKELNSRIQLGEDKVADLILSKMLEFLACTKAAIFLITEKDDRQLYSLYANKGLSQEFVDNSQNIEMSSPRAYTARTGKHAYINDMQNKDEISFLGELEFPVKVADQEGFRAILEEPLEVHGNILGSIVAYYPTSCTFREGSEELALAQMFADHAAIALENARQYEELLKAKNREKLATIGELSGDLVHRMNSPLSAIRANVQLVQMNCENVIKEHAYLGDKLQEIHMIADKAIEMVQTMKDRARTNILEATSIQKAMSLALANVEIPTNIIVEDKVAKSDPLPLVRASKQVEKVFQNLITNAIEAMPRGGRLELDAYTVGNKWVEVSVVDTGIGIHEEWRDEIFNVLSVFAKNAERKGQGLGLWYSRAYVNACGGEFPSPVSEVGKGSRFVVRFQKWQE